MSDWQAGDLALCVIAVGETRGLRMVHAVPGSVWTVEKVVAGKTYINGELVAATGLVFKEFCQYNSWRGFYAGAFRKIHPHTPDAEDAETIRIMRGEPATTEPVSLRAQHGAAEVNPFPCASAAEVSRSVHLKGSTHD